MTPKQINVDLTKELAAAVKALQPAVTRLTRALKADFTKLPSGAAADLLYDMRQTRQQLNSLTAPLDDLLAPAVKALEEHFVNTLKADESSGVQGKYSRVQVTPNDIPTVNPEGWPKLYAYIKRTGAFELLNRAVNREAVKERWRNKKQVPGVTIYHDKKVSCTKLSGKGGA